MLRIERYAECVKLLFKKVSYYLIEIFHWISKHIEILIIN